MFVVMVAGCGKEEVPLSQKRVVLDICAMVDPSTQTKFTVLPDADDGEGHYYLRATDFGIFICDHYSGSNNPYNEYAVRYNNIHAQGGNNSWRYNYFNYSEFDTLYLIPKDDNPRDGNTDIGCDIFAYAPYQYSVTSMEAIPFSIINQTDVMYAAENGVSNLDIDPAAYQVAPYNGRLPVPLTFKHALSLLEFDFELKNDTYNHPFVSFTDVEHHNDRTVAHLMQSITVEKTRNAAHIYSEGKMNALNGSLYDLTEVSSLTAFSLGLNRSNNPVVQPYEIARAYMVWVPTQPGDDYVDGDYVFTFRFSGQDLPITFTLLREHLLHHDAGTPPSTYGFLPGYKYTFHFTIDNYVHFDGVNISDWDSIAEPAFQTEI